MGHAFGVAYGIGDRYRATLRDAEQREALDAGGIDDGFQVAHEGLEGTLLDLAVGKAVAAGVVADQRMIPRELAIEMPPDRASKSNSRWVIQFPVLTSGGPRPIRE